DPTSFQDFLRENAFFEDRNLNDDDFFKTEAKVNKKERPQKPAETKTNEDDERRSIEIIIPLISEDKNLYPLFRSFFILLIVASIVIFGIKSVHFDGYIDFSSDNDYQVEDARKLFCVGKFIDSYNCYKAKKKSYYLNYPDREYYTAAKAMVNLNWKDSPKRIFIKCPKLPFSYIFEKKKGYFENMYKDELPTWVKAELYETAENYFNNKTSNNYYADEIDIATIYEVCRSYKDSRDKYNKYKNLIEYSTKR
ncbi:MAG: hypothetical protein J6Z11_06005, partial [Candidatus Riflebacteria bacterium]|nr:hypothetical protein [Candidatus Riflebacteria bacterium]